MLPGWLASVIFFSILGLLIGSQIFWFWLARRFVRARPTARQRWLFGVPLYLWFLGLFGVFVLAPLRWLLLDHAPVLLSVFQQVRKPAVMIPVGLWVTSSLVAFLFIALVQGAGRLAGRVRRFVASSPEPAAPARRHFLQTATYLAGALPFVGAGYGFLIGRQSYRVQEVEVPVRNLPAALDGLRLLQLTDVHSSAYMPVHEIRRVVEIARETQPDLVVHTGDYLTSRGDPLEPAIAELSRLEGRYGRFGCLGNHEIYARATRRATELFAERGVRILRNESTELAINGARLNLLGVDYQRQPRGLSAEEWTPYFLRGMEGRVRADVPNILLTHNPNPFLRAAELGIELTLSGHTHGGQVQVEILDSRWSMARFITPFISGLFERRGNRLYVSRGIGTIAAPIRLNAPPEITLLTLRREA